MFTCELPHEVSENIYCNLVFCLNHFFFFNPLHIHNMSKWFTKVKSPVLLKTKKLYFVVFFFDY